MLRRDPTLQLAYIPRRGAGDDDVPVRAVIVWGGEGEPVLDEAADRVFACVGARVRTKTFVVDIGLSSSRFVVMGPLPSLAVASSSS